MANKPQNKPRNHGNFGNFALGEKLQKFTPNIKTKRVFDEIKKVTDLGPDGEDHINVYTNCKTDLGAALSPFANTPFISPFYGKFNSRQGFYYYLLSKDGHEAFRTMNPVKMRSYSASLSTMGFFCPNLRYHMATALWTQIKDNQVIKQKLIDNQLPFEAYYLKRQKFENIVSHIPARPNNNAVWITKIVSVIANALKKGVDPVFDEFIDDKEQLERLKAKITRPLTPPPEPKPKKEKVKKEDISSVTLKGRGLTSPINHVDEAGYQIVSTPPALEETVVNVVHNGLAFKSVPGKGWVAGMPETTPIEALSAAVAEEQSNGVDSLPVVEGMHAVQQLREALNEGSNGISTVDLNSVAVTSAQPLDGSFVDSPDQSNSTCTLDHAPE